MKTITPLQQRKRKALLVLPLIVFVFTTLLFYTFGGGKVTAAEPAGNNHSGFNTHLPDANLKNDTNTNKLSYYDRAAADSAKLRQSRQTDPYARKTVDTVTVQPRLTDHFFSPHQSAGFDAPGEQDASPALKTVLIKARLNELQTTLHQKASASSSVGQQESATLPTVVPSYRDTNPGLVNRSVSVEDPELKQMNGLLEKILDIQHPDRLKAQQSTNTLAAVTTRFQAIPAVIDGNQKIVQGTVIRLKLMDSVSLNGQFFRKGQLIYGSGDLYNQRVKINIKLLHSGLNIIPVDLTVYDRTDGLEGISVPEAITGDAMKEGAANGVQNMDLMNFDPSVTGQLTTAGLNTAKGLFAKKVKRVKGKLKDGHELLLRDNKRPQTVESGRSLKSY